MDSVGAQVAAEAMVKETKPKRVMSEKQLETLKKARAQKAANVALRKARDAKNMSSTCEVLDEDNPRQSNA